MLQHVQTIRRDDASCGLSLQAGCVIGLLACLLTPAALSAGNCPTDFDGDGAVAGSDLGALLAKWGACGSPCPADLDGDGMVAGSDLGALLAAWGPCPPEEDLPDLTITAVWAGPIPVAPGEPLFVRARVRNVGAAPASAIEVAACDGGGWCGSATVGTLPSGAEALVTIVLDATAAHMADNPHFFTVEADFIGAIPELDETNNDATTIKPAFVVIPQLVAPTIEPEHDEVIDLADGKATSYEVATYGLDGGPSENGAMPDPQKGEPHPVTGFVEQLESGVPEQPLVDPLVAQADAQAQPGQKIVYLVKYAHGVPMPRLPDLKDKSGRFAAANVEALNQSMSWYEGVRRARIESAAPLAQLVNASGGSVLEHFTLSGTMRIEAPKGLLTQLAQHPLVRHVEAVSGGEVPPDSVADGRALIKTDPYFSAGATGTGFMALLDSGVWDDHDLLESPDRIWFREDCVNGNSYCADTGSSSYDPSDDFWDHGTATAAILTGNDDLGNDSRGVTAGWIDSWKVYSTSGLSTTATLRGFDEAVKWRDKIIVAEIQSTQGITGSIAECADNAFDAGSCTIAANGNYGPSDGTVASPACAHKAIGVGCYDVDSLAQQSYQSDGPTSDSRYKPDIQAPTNTDTASISGASDIDNFGGTSGATPYAAGAASLVADWYDLSDATSTAAAGKIYAILISGGPRDWGYFDNEQGVGKFELPLNGTLILGSRNLTKHDNDYVDFYVPASADTIRVAIWWGENSGDTHRDIDLYLRKPDGSTSASSLSVPSVFEHIVVSNPAAGWRDIRIYGYDMPGSATQTVYFAIHVE